MTDEGIVRQFRIVGRGEDNVIDLKIAFATDDGVYVNQHFGTAKSFVIYGINPESYSISAVAEFESLENENVTDKLADKLAFLEGCVAVYCRACGASAVTQLLEKQIQPLKVVNELSIKDLVLDFQKELNDGPSSWLAKAIKHKQGVDMYSCESNWDEP